MAAIPEWLQIIGYIIPLIVSVGGATFIYLRDKASIKKTKKETEELDTESDRQDSKLSLDWALQFKDRMEKLEASNEQLRDKLTETQKTVSDLSSLNVQQNARIIKLENEISVLTKENGLLKARVKELESENKKLKGDI